MEEQQNDIQHQSADRYDLDNWTDHLKDAGTPEPSVGPHSMEEKAPQTHHPSHEQKGREQGSPLTRMAQRGCKMPGDTKGEQGQPEIGDEEGAFEQCDVFLQHGGPQTWGQELNLQSAMYGMQLAFPSLS